MKKDYSNFYENPPIFIDDYGKRVETLVINCDYDFGITIVAKNNTERKLVCLNGPSSKNQSDCHAISYKTIFYGTIGMMRKGSIKSEILLHVERLLNGHLGGFGMADCAFSA